MRIKLNPKHLVTSYNIKYWKKTGLTIIKVIYSRGLTPKHNTTFIIS